MLLAGSGGRDYGTWVRVGRVASEGCRQTPYMRLRRGTLGSGRAEEYGAGWRGQGLIGRVTSTLAPNEGYAHSRQPTSPRMSSPWLTLTSSTSAAPTAI